MNDRLLEKKYEIRNYKHNLAAIIDYKINLSY